MTETTLSVLDNAQIHDDMEDRPSNLSENRPFSDILAAAASRRKVLQGSLMGAAAGFLAPQALSATATQARNIPVRGLINFTPVSIEDAAGDQTLPTISPDYQYQSFIPWGTPIEPGIVREFDGNPNARPNSREARLQIGVGHDGMVFFPEGFRFNPFSGMVTGNSTTGMLCVNHEFGSNFHVLGKTNPDSLEDVRISQHIHGVSVVAIRGGVRGWEVIKSPNARRITVNTPVTFSGPAAGSALLQNPAGNIALGTVNNCGSGFTPWGTYLTCEENFNGYFGSNGPLPQTEALQRYGFSSDGFGYGWHRFDQRFDLSDPDYVNENNRFGWIVEIDPFDGTQIPVKRTAMGRFKHEAVAIGVNRRTRRVAAYMGDDQRGDYCYKYLSDEAWDDVIADGRSPLDHGVLFVARFNEDGTGDWLELSMNNPALAGRFADQAELLINTRIAADIVGATPMDRPEWTTIGRGSSVFWTLTNNNRKDRGIGEVNAANPEFDNTDGHIIRTVDRDDFLGNSFTWEIFILASSTRGTPHVFTDPDAAYADPFGRLFIGTDGGQPDGLQDQVVVFDTTRPGTPPRRLLVGVTSDELTGWAYTPNFKTAFVNVQHPGSGDPARTSFPKPFDGQTIPRDATLVITRKDGGIIGS